MELGSILSPARALARGWAVNVLNPKPAPFYLAAFPQFVGPALGHVLAQGVALGDVHATIAALWYGSVVMGIEKSHAWLRRPGV